MADKSTSTQVPRSTDPILRGSTLRQNGELLQRLRKVHLVKQKEREETSFKTSARDLVRHFLSALAPAPAEAENPSTAKDMENLRKAIGSIMQAAEDDVLTENEANAVINFITERFVERRFDDVLKHIAIPQSRGWFVVGDHLFSELNKA